MYPIILGVSQPANDEATLQQYRDNSNALIDINGKTKTRYQWSQEMRKVETAVRQQKDVANLAKASGDDVARREAQSKINRLQEYYDKLTEKAGIQAEKERMTVSGFRAVKVDSNLTFIDNDAKIKAASGLPKVLKGLPNERTKATADVDFLNIHGVVPKGADASSVIVMAGDGTSTPIRDLARLYKSYPKYGKPQIWQKKTGTVKTGNYTYELHWYEANGKVPPAEIKVKRVK